MVENKNQAQTKREDNDTRASLDGSAEFLRDQAMTVEEALESYTAMGAKASFEEQEKGRLLPGMAADFVILKEDIRKCQKERIKDVEVLGTFVNGSCVYQCFGQGKQKN